MPNADHENYAQDLLLSLSDRPSETEIVDFNPNSKKSRNAAGAMTAILCHRLFKKSTHRPRHMSGTTYEWKEGIFNCRNIADRDYLWTNIRRRSADEMYDAAQSKPVVYLMACSDPSNETLCVWAIPQPIIYDCLADPSFKDKDEAYSIEIRKSDQRIKDYSASPDLEEYFYEFPLSRQEFLVLEESRKMDSAVKLERKIEHGDEDADDGERSFSAKAEIRLSLGKAAKQLNDAGAFDPEEITDARDRVFASIVRRRGQPAFRQQLLASYDRRCVISGCDVEDVLDAAHIVPYSGPATNHPCNGLLFRADLHILFDLKLIAIDVATMTLLVSSELTGTYYDEYRGRRIREPNDSELQPSREALSQHRNESGL